MLQKLTLLLALLAAANGAPENAMPIDEAAQPAMSAETDEETPESITEEQALDIVADLSLLPEGYTMEDIKLEQMPAVFTFKSRRQIDPFHQGPAYWIIRYAPANGEGPEWVVQLDAPTGKLISFYRDNPPPEPMYSPSVSFENAKEIAAAFVQRINGDIMNQLQYDDSQDATFTHPQPGTMLYSYRVVYNRMKNGIAYPQNNVNLTVDGEGKIISYNYNWDSNVEFEDPAAAMDAQQAERVFRNHITPMYLVPFERPENAAPVYTFFPHDQLEATTGRFLDANQLPLMEVSAKPLAAQPKVEYPIAPSAPLTQEEATERAVALLNIPKGSSLKRADLNGNLWVLTFESDSQDNPANDLVVLNRSTGLLVNYYHGRPFNGQDLQLPRSVARIAADQFLEKMMPYALHELFQLEFTEGDPYNTDMTGGILYYNYRQMHRGVWLGDIRIGVDSRNGEAVEFAGNTQLDVKLPYIDLAERIPAEAAQDAVFARNQLELVYVSPYEPRSFNGDYSDALEYAKNTDPSRIEARLVYRWKFYLYYDNAAVDARTGDWIDTRYGEKLP